MRNPKEIIRNVCKKYGITLKELKGKSRTQYYVRARQEATFLLREELKLSYPYIGRILGDRDHTTAIYSYKEFVKPHEPSIKIYKK